MRTTTEVQKIDGATEDRYERTKDLSVGKVKALHGDNGCESPVLREFFDDSLPLEDPNPRKKRTGHESSLAAYMRLSALPLKAGHIQHNLDMQGVTLSPQQSHQSDVVGREEGWGW